MLFWHTSCLNSWRASLKAGTWVLRDQAPLKLSCDSAPRERWGTEVQYIGNDYSPRNSLIRTHFKKKARSIFLTLWYLQIPPLRGFPQLRLQLLPAQSGPAYRQNSLKGRGTCISASTGRRKKQVLGSSGVFLRCFFIVQFNSESAQI